MDEQAAGSVALGVVTLIFLAFLAISLLPRGGPGALLFAATIIFMTAVVLAAVTEWRRH